MTREEALNSISAPLLDDDFYSNEIEYISGKLDFTLDEFNRLFSQENKSFLDYKSKYFLITLGSKILNKLGIEKRNFR